MDREFKLAIKIILFIFALIICGYVIISLGRTLAIVLIAGLIVISLESIVKFFMRGTLFNKSVSRSFAVIITYSLVISTFVLIFTIGLPPVIVEGQTLVLNLLQLLQKVPDIDGLRLSVSNVLPQVSQFSGGVLTFTYALFSNITTLLSILVLSVYMSLDWENLKDHFTHLFPKHLQQEVHEVLAEIESNLGYWVKGESFLMFIVGFGCFLGLYALGIKYPLALGLVAGLLEIVPILGPVLSAILAAIIAFSESPIKGVGVLVLFFIVQQLENNFLVPKIMQKVSGFSPMIILLALLIGSNFFGMVGAILSVPITIVAVIIIKRFLPRSSEPLNF